MKIFGMYELLLALKEPPESFCRAFLKSATRFAIYRVPLGFGFLGNQVVEVVDDFWVYLCDVGDFFSPTCLEPSKHTHIFSNKFPLFDGDKHRSIFYTRRGLLQSVQTSHKAIYCVRASYQSIKKSSQTISPLTFQKFPLSSTFTWNSAYPLN